MVSDLFAALLNLATFGVAGDDFPGGVSDKLVLIPTKQQTQVDLSKQRQFDQKIQTFRKTNPQVIRSKPIIIDNYSKIVTLKHTNSRSVLLLETKTE